MLKSYTIAENQRGLLVKDGRFVQVLEPGRHRFWFGDSLRCTVEVLNADGACQSYLINGIEALYPELAKKYFEVVRPDFGQVAIVRYDGQANLIVRGGETAHIWKVLHDVTVEQIDVETHPKLGADLLRELPLVSVFGKPLPAPIEAFAVGQSQSAVVLINGRLYETVGPGQYGYWQIGRSIFFETIDTSRTSFEVAVEGLLTKDRVNIEVALSAFYRVIDVERAAMAAFDYQNCVYQQVESAVRTAISKQTLGDVMNGQAKVNYEIMAYARREIGDIGVEVNELAITDVRIPHECVTEAGEDMKIRAGSDLG